MADGRHLTAAQVADLVGGELIGQPHRPLAGIAPLERAGPGELSFVLSNRYLPAFRSTAAGAVIVGPELRAEGATGTTLIVVDDPTRALQRAAAAVFPPPAVQWGIDPTARIGPGATWTGRLAVGPGAVLGRNVSLGADCVIGPQAVVEDGVAMGDACRIGSHARLQSGSVLGDRVAVHAGATIGRPGFRFHPGQNGLERVPHLGRCVLEHDVEVGANTTVDRGSMGDTVIGAGTKIDNLVQVAHNVRVGARCLIMAQVGIAGSAAIGHDVVLAGQVGVRDHVTIGDAARVGGGSAVTGDLPPGASVSGHPARSHRAVLRQAAALARLAPMVRDLERMVGGDDR